MSSPDVRRRGMGFWMATALVVGNMIGSGIFLLPSSLAKFGSISIIAWIITAIGAVALALVFAALGRSYPHTGGPYAYAKHAFGEFVGFLTAWGYWIAVWVGNAAIAVAHRALDAALVEIVETHEASATTTATPNAHEAHRGI